MIQGSPKRGPIYSPYKDWQTVRIPVGPGFAGKHGEIPCQAAHTTFILENPPSGFDRPITGQNERKPLQPIHSSQTKFPPTPPSSIRRRLGPQSRFDPWDYLKSSPHRIPLEVKTEPQPGSMLDLLVFSVCFCTQTGHSNTNWLTQGKGIHGLFCKS